MNWVVTDETGRKFKYGAAGPHGAIEQHYLVVEPLGDGGYLPPDVVSVQHIDTVTAAATVWVLTINHRHGTNIYVNKTEKGALAELSGYVYDNWDELTQRSDTPAIGISPDSDEAISYYFEVQTDEYYEIEQVAVGE